MGYLYEACDQISDFCHQIVAEKNATKNILGRTEGQTEGRTDGQTKGRTEVKQYTPSGGAGV